MESRHVPAVYCRNLIAQLCEEEGIDWDDCLAGTSILASHLESDNDFTTHSNQLKVYERVAALSTNPGIGFRLGIQSGFGDQGLLGALLYTAPNVYTAFEKLERYIDVIGGMLSYRVERRADQLLLTCAVNGPVSMKAHLLAVEESIALWTHLALPVGGLASLTKIIRFDYPQPEHLELYEAHCPDIGLEFSAPQVQIVLSEKVLDLPMPGSNPATFELLDSQCAAQLERITASARRRVQDYLQRSDPQAWTLPEVAEHLHFSPRSLRRHLAAEGISLRSVLDQHRAEMSATALASGKSIAEAALDCGFQSADAFVRAFKRWHGTTPGRFRRHT